MINVQRVKDILLNPGSTWPTIAEEQKDIASIYREYLVYLAAIPAVCSFIGVTLIGTSFMGVTVRQPFWSGLVATAVMYVLGLVAIYINAMIASALAPKFGGRDDLPSAFRLLAYSATAAMVGGVFSLVPMLWILGLIASIYSLYLLYLGVPVLMQVPAEKTGRYTAALVVIVIVMNILIGLVVGVVSGPGNSTSMRSDEDVVITLPGSDVSINVGELEAAAKRMEAASRKMEEAQASGDQQAMNEALNEMLGAGGAKPVVDPTVLKDFAPDKLGDLPQVSAETERSQASAMTISNVYAMYHDGGGSAVTLLIQDLASIPALAAGMTAWSAMTLEHETDTGAERVFRDDGIAYRESYQKDGSHSEWVALLPNSIVVELNGTQVSIEDLREMSEEIDLDGLAGIERPDADAGQ